MWSMNTSKWPGFFPINSFRKQKTVAIDPKYFRHTEVDVLLGDSTKAQKALGWKPKVGFEKLVEMMITMDLEMAHKEKTLRDAGYCMFGQF